MRSLFLSAMLLCPTIAAASDLPPALGPESAVSAPNFGPAPNAQGVPLLATNGDITLAIWLDQRDQANRFVAARVDNFGNVLDPLGIHFPLHSSVDALVWDGTQFAIVGTLGSERIITYLNLDGVITG